MFEILRTVLGMCEELLHADFVTDFHQRRMAADVCIHRALYQRSHTNWTALSWWDAYKLDADLPDDEVDPKLDPSVRARIFGAEGLNCTQVTNGIFAEQLANKKFNVPQGTKILSTIGHLIDVQDLSSTLIEVNATDRSTGSALKSNPDAQSGKSSAQIGVALVAAVPLLAVALAVAAMARSRRARPPIMA